MIRRRMRSCQRERRKRVSKKGEPARLVRDSPCRRGTRSSGPRACRVLPPSSGERALRPRQRGGPQQTPPATTSGPAQRRWRDGYEVESVTGSHRDVRSLLTRLLVSLLGRLPVTTVSPTWPSVSAHLFERIDIVMLYLLTASAVPGEISRCMLPSPTRLGPVRMRLGRAPLTVV